MKNVEIMKNFHETDCQFYIFCDGLKASRDAINAKGKKLRAFMGNLHSNLN
ncbi:MAG: hypothetical protein JWQ14_2022 [Adhaeribacter sp.]|nr:hypothetical protein [Adhaeribacter sp.]